MILGRVVYVGTRPCFHPLRMYVVLLDDVGLYTVACRGITSLHEAQIDPDAPACVALRCFHDAEWDDFVAFFVFAKYFLLVNTSWARGHHGA